MSAPMKNRIDFLIERVQKQNPSANVKKIRAAYECAAKAHEGQKRRNGEPYIIHPVAVAEIIVEMGLDTDSICAGLLHDCIEDTDSTHDDIAKQFGTTVAELVEGVTKLTRMQYTSKEEEQMGCNSGTRRHWPGAHARMHPLHAYTHTPQPSSFSNFSAFVPFVAFVFPT